jgi:DNA-binding transcriptional ArsR family regulator
MDSWRLDLQKSTVSHHLRILREAGLVEYRLRGRNKDARLRRSILDERFPGLIEGVLASA